MWPLKRIRSCGAYIGAGFDYLGPNGHSWHFAAWDTESGIMTRNTFAGSEMPLPSPMSAQMAKQIAACFASAARRRIAMGES